MIKRNKDQILKSVNKIYSEQNPSTYFRNYNKFKTYVANREKWCLKLKLHKRIFNNSSLLDLGSGTGQNTIGFSIMGANCTLVEYDKKSYIKSLKLFKKFSKKKYKIFNKDIFKFKNKNKFDFVISNGVAHHTKDPKKNIEIACKFLKKNGFIILGIGNSAGFFQRALQRYVLYKVSNNNEDINNYSKLFFPEHLKRSVKFSGRTINEVIADTYINPKIETFNISNILKIFSKHKIDFYSSYPEVKNIENFLEPVETQFKSINNKKSVYNLKLSQNMFLSELQWLSLTNNKINNKHFYKQFKKLSILNNKLTKLINNKNTTRHKINSNIFLKFLLDYKRRILSISKVELINKKHNKAFINELVTLLKLLEKKQKKHNKVKKLIKFFKKSKTLFKLYCGVGINYFVGIKT